MFLSGCLAMAETLSQTGPRDADTSLAQTAHSWLHYIEVKTVEILTHHFENLHNEDTLTININTSIT